MALDVGVDTSTPDGVEVLVLGARAPLARFLVLSGLVQAQHGECLQLSAA